MAFFVLFQNTSDRSCFPDTQSLRDKGAFVFTRQRGLRDDKQDKSEVTQLTEWMMKPLTMSLIVKGYRVSHFCIWNLNTISMAWNRNTFYAVLSLFPCYSTWPSFIQRESCQVRFSSQARKRNLKMPNHYFTLKIIQTKSHLNSK